MQVLRRPRSRVASTFPSIVARALSGDLNDDWLLARNFIRARQRRDRKEGKGGGHVYTID